MAELLKVDVNGNWAAPSLRGQVSLGECVGELDGQGGLAGSIIPEGEQHPRGAVVFGGLDPVLAQDVEGSRPDSKPVVTSHYGRPAGLQELEHESGSGRGRHVGPSDHEIL